MTALLVGLAGAAGALARYGVVVVVGARGFPVATLGVNVAGSFLLGLLATWSGARGWPETVTYPLLVGFLGAFTTFSTFSFEAYALLRDGRPGPAAAYVAASVLGGLVAAAVGVVAARALAG